MTLDEAQVGDVILVPVRVVDYPGRHHEVDYQKLCRGMIGNQVVYLSEEVLKNAEKRDSEIKEP